MFAHGEDGAVTVDWIVITAVVVGLCVILLAPISLTVGSRVDAMNVSVVQAD